MPVSEEKIKEHIEFYEERAKATDKKDAREAKVASLALQNLLK